jgi:hypothetical protein
MLPETTLNCVSAAARVSGNARARRSSSVKNGAACVRYAVPPRSMGAIATFSA